MSLYILDEARLSVLSFLLGLILMVSYDLLRLFRLLVPHGNLWTGLEDLIYWIYCAVMTFSLLFWENSGILRGYVIACVFSGMILYDRIVSRNVFGLLKKLGRWITIKRSSWKDRREVRKNGRKAK